MTFKGQHSSPITCVQFCTDKFIAKKYINVKIFSKTSFEFIKRYFEFPRFCVKSFLLCKKETCWAGCLHFVKVLNSSSPLLLEHNIITLLNLTVWKEQYKYKFNWMARCAIVRGKGNVPLLTGHSGEIIKQLQPLWSNLGNWRKWLTSLHLI